jgi:steroid delta-isomerase-like uncharacterized protein
MSRVYQTGKNRSLCYSYAMHQDAKALVHRWFDEVWNQGREDTIDELFTHGVAYGLGESDVTVRGPSDFKVFFHTMRSTFPDLRINIEDSVAEGDKCAVRVVLEGTHSGPGFGVPPTGRRIHVAGIVIIHAAGGKLTAGWNTWDQLGLLRQIGALPGQTGTDRFLAKEE